MPESLPVNRKRVTLYFIGYWLILAGVQTGILNYYGFSGVEYVWDGIITYALLALIILVVRNVFISYQPGRENGIYWCFLAGMATLVWAAVDKWILGTFIYPADQQDWLKESMPLRFVMGCLNNLWVLATLYFQQKGGSELMREERRSSMEQSVKDAELYKLRQQLHPHFLFNSLNSINALIHSKPEKAREMVQQLSAFLRGTLKQEENHFISLEDEIAYLKLYLDIEKVRFGHRLKTEFNLQPEVLSCRMPPLMLQPLMENAIKYGIYGTTEQVTIYFKARHISPYLVVAVKNPYDTEQQMQAGTGFGLTSVQRRLYLLFGRDDLLEINRNDEQFEVIFRIPQSYDESSTY